MRMAILLYGNGLKVLIGQET